MSRVVNTDARDTDVDFLVYTTQYCPYCTAAKRLLSGNDLSYQEVQLDNEPHKLQTLSAETGHRTVPIIFDLRGEEPRYVGGFDQLRAEQG